MKKRETAKPHYPQDNYTLVEHLTELRSRLIYCIFAVGVFGIAGWIFSEQIFDYIRKPIEPYLPSGGLVFTALTDKFMAHIKVAVLTGIVAACPVWIFHIWRFVAPGLYSREKRYGLIFIFLGSLLFLVGIAFAYFLVMPLACKELINFGGTTDKPMITISEYMSFFMTTLLLFGAAFEMPLILNLLGLMGIVTSRGLRHVRRYAIVGIAVVAAIFTPPDVMSMMLLGVPLCLLYEASIWILYFIEPSANKR